MPYRVVNTSCLDYRSTSKVTVYRGTITLRSKNHTKMNKADNIGITLTIRRVRVTIKAAEKQLVLRILSVCV